MKRSDEHTPATVDEYLDALPPDQRAVLQQVREAIRAAAPEAAEVISYKIPAFKYHARSSASARPGGIAPSTA